MRRLLTKEAARRRDSDAGSDWIVSGGIVASDSGSKEFTTSYHSCDAVCAHSGIIQFHVRMIFAANSAKGANNLIDAFVLHWGHA